MKIISLKEIVECNAYMKEKNLDFKIHIRDACGRQSCWIEPLNDCEGEKNYDSMYQALDEFFSASGNLLEYSEDRLNFWLKQ